MMSVSSGGRELMEGRAERRGGLTPPIQPREKSQRLAPAAAAPFSRAGRRQSGKIPPENGRKPRTPPPPGTAR